MLFPQLSYVKALIEWQWLRVLSEIRSHHLERSQWREGDLLLKSAIPAVRETWESLQERLEQLHWERKEW